MESQLGRVAVHGSECGAFVFLLAQQGSLWGEMFWGFLQRGDMAGDFPAGTSTLLLPAASLRDLQGLSPGSATAAGRRDRACGLCRGAALAPDSPQEL